MSYQLRRANQRDVPEIWSILQEAIAKRKVEGSQQWQNGYPNLKVIQSDMAKKASFVLTEKEEIIGCCSLFINDEPIYNEIDGEWLTTGDFIAFHRLAIKASHVGKGLSSKTLELIEKYAQENKIYSIKADTNFDNPAMLGLFKKMGYTYCGEVNVREKPRNAFEKILEKR